MPSVFANGRSIVHKGDGQINTAAPPDVCKTPSPGGPVPIPYVNIARTSDLAKGTKKVKIEGNPAGNAGSNISTSMGDEAGTAGGGLLSSKTKGKMTWATKSANVKLEGKGAVRFMDVAQHNGNSFNTVFIEKGGTGFAYADDFVGLCPICKKDPEEHAVPELIEGSHKTANEILQDLLACEQQWKNANTQVQKAAGELRRLVEKNPNVKPATIKAREARIEALEKARDALAKHRRENSSGYMFGVMVCLTGKKFAAVSGGETPEKFEQIAQSHGCTVIKDAATVEDFKAMNSKPEDVEELWDAAMHSHTSQVSGYNNKPGTCAGAKLIGKSGHIADSMSEIYFSFVGGKKALTFNVIYRGPGEFAPGDGPWEAPTAEQVEGKKAIIEERRDMRRKKELTVPSCESCQDTLFMARCDIKEKNCG